MAQTFALFQSVSIEICYCHSNTKMLKLVHIRLKYSHQNVPTYLEYGSILKGIVNKKKKLSS